jgi:methionyl-tRNA formyltransferase
MARLVFLGTPDAAVLPLQTLVGAGHQIELVVSRPDRRRQRRGGSDPSPVKQAALDLGLVVTDALEDVSKVEAELAVVVAYGRIIPAAMLEQLPMVNLHFSLLPRWRGAAPVERAILEGDGETGVCLMAVEAGLDTGGIYAQAETDIDDEVTAIELRSRLVQLGCQLLVEHLAQGVAGLPVPHDQAGEPSYAEKIHASELELHWEQPGVQIRRVVRLGRAWTTFRGKRVHILRATGTPLDSDARSGERSDLPPGTLDDVDVVAGDGERVRLLTVQPADKRPMEAAAWLRGVRPRPGERLGE